VIKVYKTGGFVVQTMMMNMEFEKLVDLLSNVTIDTTATQEHVGEIEQKIQVIKERARGTMNTGMVQAWVGQKLLNITF
jgi:hypothetical protein